MALIKQESGCKVGWYTYDNEAEAKAASAQAARDAARMARQGYDFGYQVVGGIQKVAVDGKLAYRVTIP
jgi:hypothetical protein